MTPLEIRMLLHYHYSGEPYAVQEPEHANSPAVMGQRNGLINNGLLIKDDNPHSGYKLTDRGRAHVENLCSLPWPVCKWVLP